VPAGVLWSTATILCTVVTTRCFVLFKAFPCRVHSLRRKSGSLLIYYSRNVWKWGGFGVIDVFFRPFTTLIFFLSFICYMAPPRVEVPRRLQRHGVDEIDHKIMSDFDPPSILVGTGCWDHFVNGFWGCFSNYLVLDKPDTGSSIDFK